MTGPAAAQPTARAWALALGGALLVLLLGLGLLWALVDQAPVPRELVEQVAPPSPPKAVARAGEQVARAHAEGEASRLLLEVVDRDGMPAAGVALLARACRLDGPQDHPWQPLSTDARGEAEVELVACAELSTDDPGWRLVGPAVIPLGPPQVPARVEVARRCPGPVEVTLAGAPFVGQVQLFPGGGGALHPYSEGVLDLPGRLCGPVEVWVHDGGPRGSRREWRLSGQRVDEGWPLRIELEGAVEQHRAGPWQVEVHFQGGDLPDQVRAFPRQPCQGEGPDWTCPCAGPGPCVIEAWWQEALFDWRFTKEPVASVPPGQGEVWIDLDRAPADLLLRWAGPMPCAAVATDLEGGVEVRGECLPDGTAWIEGLREGPWRVEVAWAPGGDADPGTPARVVREVVMTGDDLDLGTLSPP